MGKLAPSLRALIEAVKEEHEAESEAAKERTSAQVQQAFDDLRASVTHRAEWDASDARAWVLIQTEGAFS
jgi:F0F1-type ATP synthase membrane subunit b/b'